MYHYTQVSDNESTGEESHHLRPRQRYSWASAVCRLYVPWAWIFQSILFVASCGFFLVGLKFREDNSEICQDKDFLPMWSPVLDAVQGTGHFRRFDGSFATPNLYKGSPSPQIDKAWDRVLMAEGDWGLRSL
jgi:hypothetical protein